MATVHDQGNMDEANWQYANGFVPYDGRGVIHEDDLNRVSPPPGEPLVPRERRRERPDAARPGHTRPGLLLLFRS